MNYLNLISLVGPLNKLKTDLEIYMILTNKMKKGKSRIVFVFCCCFLAASPCFGQSTQIILNNLSAFKDAGKTWQVAENIVVHPDKSNTFIITKGTGILLNQPGRKRLGTDLITQDQYGDLDLELDFLLTDGSDSGIIFGDAYELELKDSWGTQFITSAVNGGIHWKHSDTGEQRFYGSAPRQNVSKAPGLWQHLKVSFQAPRFDENGEKIENGKFLYVELNGVTVQENVELFAPAEDGVAAKEEHTAPLRIQGDNPIAFRNIKATKYGKPRPELKDLRYTVYQGKFTDLPSFDSIPPEFEGPSVLLTSNLRTKSNQFLIRYSGNLEVMESGEYTFRLDFPGGSGSLKIDDKEIIPFKEWNGKATIKLEAGVFPFELFYSKYEDWVEPGLGLNIVGPGIREYLVSDGNENFQTPPDPILVEAGKNTLLRSFMDLPVTKSGLRVSHAVSVGSPLKVHYTYDLNKGTIVQLWRGGFLDATPMWYSRGDGSSRPVGSVQYFGVPEFTVTRLSTPNESWPADTTGSRYKPGGYQLNERDQPSFFYKIHGADVQDAIHVLDNAHGIQRTISIENTPGNLYVRLAQGNKIESVSKNLYIIDDKAYYLRIDDSGENKPYIRTLSDRQELLIPVDVKIVYSVLF